MVKKTVLHKKTSEIEREDLSGLAPTRYLQKISTIEPMSKVRVVILQANDLRTGVMELGNMSFFLGRDQNLCKFILEGARIGDRQIAIVPLGGCAAICNAEPATQVCMNGVNVPQILLKRRGRVYIEVEDAIVIIEDFTDDDVHNVGERSICMFHLPQLNHPIEQNFSLQVNIDGQDHYTIGQTVVIGSHEMADIILDDPNIRPFHFMLYYSPSGLQLKEMGLGEISDFSKQIDQSLSLDLEGHGLQVAYHGDINGFIHSYIGDGKLYFGYFRFSAMDSSASPAFNLPLMGGVYLVGRSPTCHVTLPDTACSREHIRLIPKGWMTELIDNNSANGCFLNDEQAVRTSMRAGDILEVGRSLFILHFY